MRLATAVALGALIASPTLAQTQYADSSGGFASLNGITLVNLDVQAIDGTAGYRFSNGTDVGLRYKTAGYGDSGFGASSGSFAVGPVVGITRRLGSGFTGRLEGTAQYEAYDANNRGSFTLPDGQFVEPFSYRGRNLYESISATVSRRVPLVGSLALRPTLGGYVTAFQRLSFDYSGPGRLDRPQTEASTGI